MANLEEISNLRMRSLFVFACCLFVLSTAALSDSTTCEDFQYDKACVASPDNLEGEVSVDLIEDSPNACQDLCLAITTCNWFNYFPAESCQILRYCRVFEDSPFSVTGPRTPDIESCPRDPCSLFWYDYTCVISDNLLGEVVVDMIGDSAGNCQDLCLSFVSCEWFNYFKQDKCQLLTFCEDIEEVEDAVSGPKSPDIDTCIQPPFHEVSKTPFYCHTHISHLISNILGSVHAVDCNVFPLQKIVLIIGGNGDDSIPTPTQVITDHLEVLAGVVPDPPVDNLEWIAQHIGRIAAALFL